MDSAINNERRRRAIALHHGNRISQAIALYRGHLQDHPEDAGIWMNLGVAYRTQKRWNLAIACHKQALVIRPGFADCWSNLGNACKDADRIDEAVSCHERALALAPQSRLYRFNYAITLHEARIFTRALGHLDALVLEDPAFYQYRWERALVHLAMGNFAAGWQDYRARFELGILPERTFTCPPWQGESLEGRTILIVGEQGYGDTILAARLLPLIARRGASIIFMCKPELRPVFSGLPVRDFAPHDPASPCPKADCYAYQMDLFGLLGINQSAVPPPVSITIPPASLKKFGFITQEPRRKIGIIWSGSPTFKGNFKRECPLDHFAGLTENTGIRLYSLQKGMQEKELENLGATPLITDLSPHIRDFGDTAAAISHLDLVLMTDSSVAHLAASMNKPVINLLCFRPYWLYFPQSETTPWYPSMHCVWQERPGDWDGVFKKVRVMLEKQ